MRLLPLLAFFFVYSTCLFAETKTCTVNSDSYSQSARDGLEVPIVDGAEFRIHKNGNILKSVTIQNEKFFKRCNQEFIKIDALDTAKRILKYTGETDLVQFIDLSLFNCMTADEGYLFILGEKMNYLGYLGQYDLPVSLVALDCK